MNVRLEEKRKNSPNCNSLVWTLTASWETVEVRILVHGYFRLHPFISLEAVCSLPDGLQRHCHLFGNLLHSLTTQTTASKINATVHRYEVKLSQ
jgi:hypothetical protein